jgi:hypothetical protein
MPHRENVDWERGKEVARGGVGFVCPIPTTSKMRGVLSLFMFHEIFSIFIYTY